MNVCNDQNSAGYQTMYLNFLVSVLASIGYHGWLFMLFFEGELNRGRTGNFITLIVFVTTCYQLMVNYRSRQGHLQAFIIGLLVVIPEIGRLLAAGQHGGEAAPAQWQNYLGFYIFISHWLYAFTEPQKLFKGLG